MSGVVPPPSQEFVAMMGHLLNRVKALETQQQIVISNLSGQAVLYTGLQPGSNPALFGLTFVNPSTGQPVMFIGEQSDGTASVRFFDASGHERARLGQLASGDYGLSATDTGGKTVEILPVYQQTDNATVVVTSGSDVPIGTAFNVPIGASGSALVTVSLYQGLTVANQSGIASVYANSATTGLEAIVSCSGGNTVAATVSATQLLNFPPNTTQSFQLYGRSSVPGSGVNMAQKSVIVQPV